MISSNAFTMLCPKVEVPNEQKEKKLTVTERLFTATHRMASLETKTIATTLCSRNFQNAKLRLDFVEVDYFTATKILREIQFWPIQMVQKCHFW